MIGDGLKINKNEVRTKKRALIEYENEGWIKK
jgi:hypothetical protein